MYFPLPYSSLLLQKEESLTLKVLSLKILDTHKFFLQWSLWKTVFSRITDCFVTLPCDLHSSFDFVTEIMSHALLL